MKKKEKESVELRFYEIPQNEAALVLAGSGWERIYGHDEIDKYGKPRLHFHNLMEIGYCRRGRGVMHLDERVERYETGMLTIIPEKFPHITISEGENTNFWEYIFFDPKLIVAELYPNNPNVVRDIIASVNKGVFIIEGEKIAGIERLVISIIEEFLEQKPYSSRMINMYIKALTIELMRLNEEMPYYPYESEKRATMQQISTAIDYIEEHYKEAIKVQDISKACNMSETHFRRTFEEYVNMTPVDYVNLVRIQKMCELIKNTNDSMEDIAIKCGFNTTSTMNRNFKKYLGTSPYQWKLSSADERKLINYRVSARPGWK